MGRARFELLSSLMLDIYQSISPRYKIHKYTPPFILLRIFIFRSNLYNRGDTTFLPFLFFYEIIPLRRISFEKKKKTRSDLAGNLIFPIFLIYGIGNEMEEG